MVTSHGGFDISKYVAVITIIAITHERTRKRADSVRVCLAHSVSVSGAAPGCGIGGTVLESRALSRPRPPHRKFPRQLLPQGQEDHRHP